jgi:hypothetical protein
VADFRRQCKVHLRIVKAVISVNKDNVETFATPRQIHQGRGGFFPNEAKCVRHAHFLSLTQADIMEVFRLMAEDVTHGSRSGFHRVG